MIERLTDKYKYTLSIEPYTAKECSLVNFKLLNTEFIASNCRLIINRRLNKKEVCIFTTLDKKLILVVKESYYFTERIFTIKFDDVEVLDFNRNDFAISSGKIANEEDVRFVIMDDMLVMAFADIQIELGTVPKNKFKNKMKFYQINIKEFKNGKKIRNFIKRFRRA